MIYLIVFFSSTFLLYIAQKNLNKAKYNIMKMQYKTSSFVYIIIALILPIILAALRSSNIGSDVQVYVIPYFERAVRSSSFVQYKMETRSDLFYEVINYLVSRFTSKYIVLFGLIEFLIVFFIYKGCNNYSIVVKPWYSMLVFFLVFYNMTLSTLRQGCALAIFFYAISITIKYDFSKKSKIKTFVLLLIALGFHTSAILGIFIWSFIILCKKENIRNNLYLFIIIGCILLRFLLPVFLPLIQIIIGSLNSKYSNLFYYQNTGVQFGGYTAQIVLGIVTMLILFLNLHKKNQDSEVQIIFNSARFYLFLIYTLILLFVSQYAFIPRMMYYIQIFEIISLPQFENIFKHDKYHRCFARITMIGFLLFYWWFFYIHGDVHGTYPYAFGVH